MAAAESKRGMHTARMARRRSRTKSARHEPRTQQVVAVSSLEESGIRRFRCIITGREYTTQFPADFWREILASLFAGSKWSIYLFASGNSLNRLDPSGKIDWGSWGGCVRNHTDTPIITTIQDPGTIVVIEGGDVSDPSLDIDYVWYNDQWWKINQRWNDPNCCVAIRPNSITWECCRERSKKTYQLTGKCTERTWIECKSTEYVRRTGVYDPYGGGLPEDIAQLASEW